MKIFILLLVATLGIACGNKKAAIVEQIKTYKDSLTVVAKRQLDLSIEISKMQEKYVGEQALDSVYALEMRQSPLKAELFVKRIKFESKIDSLELELKKY